MNITPADVAKAKEELWKVVPMGHGKYLNILITRIEQLQDRRYGN